MSADISDLLVKLESAECGGRELDEAIVLGVCPEAHVAIYIEGDEEKTVFHANALGLTKHELPHYTTSLDAALTLVPQGWWYVIRPESAIIGPPDACDDCESKIKDAFDIATAPLALCIAALKARQANDQST